MSDDEFGMDVTPLPTMLNSFIAETVKWHILMAEGIDNALDAGASRIAITVGANRLDIEDNGSGVTRDRVKSLFTFGDSSRMSTTALGRYGVGIKWQAVNAATNYQVRSISVDGIMEARVDWDAFGRRGIWRVPHAVWEERHGEPTGTVITISNFRKKRPQVRVLEAAREELALRFRPALISGCTIMLDGIAIPALPDPPLTDVVEETIDMDKGRIAKVYGGLLKEPGKLNMVHISYGHRVIAPGNTSFGTDSYGGTSNMYARVHLEGGGWHLDRFKEAIHNDDIDELSEQVTEVLRPILEKCATTSLEARDVRLTEDLNEMIPEQMQAARPRRKKPEDTDRKPGQEREPRHQHGETKDPEPGQTGPARARKGARRLAIELQPNLCKDHGVGKFVPGVGSAASRILLATDCPYVAECIDASDRPNVREARAGTQALYALAMAIFVAENSDPQPGFFDDSYGLNVWTLLQHQQDLVENRIAKVAKVEAAE